MAKRYKTEAIVLASRPYSEGDRILVVFSKEYGKLSLIAKGARKLKSRKRGSLGVFNKIAFSAAKGKSLDIVTEVETLDSFNGVRGDLKKVSVAYFLTETVGRLTKEEEKNAELFALLDTYLDDLKNKKSLKSLRHKFVQEVLVLLGFWPEGKEIKDPDKLLEEVAERRMYSARVGKKILTGD